MTKLKGYPDYYDDEHWHISYDADNYEVEGIGFKRRDGISILMVF
ncbi:DUF3986 family protein [Bacillus sp. V59.32b]|nr:DUF3986 family protein [Bacillus sp. V59.32b]RFU60511.1 DUF3986 family protein [Bacillus sp. V59.32b]